VKPILVFVFALLFTLPAAHGQRFVKKWVLEHKVKRVTEALIEGQRVTVVFIDGPRKRRVLGKIAGIASDTLFLYRNPQGLERIPTQTITNIKVAKRKSDDARTAGAILSVLAIVAMVVIFVLAAVSAVLTVASWGVIKDEGEKSRSNGCVVSILLLAAGIALFAVRSKASIKGPFSGDWTITELTVDTWQEVDKIP
jgi:hypothetical protein